MTVPSTSQRFQLLLAPAGPLSGGGAAQGIQEGLITEDPAVHVWLQLRFGGRWPWPKPWPWPRGESAAGAPPVAASRSP